MVSNDFEVAAVEVKVKMFNTVHNSQELSVSLAVSLFSWGESTACIADYRIVLCQNCSNTYWARVDQDGSLLTLVEVGHHRGVGKRLFQVFKRSALPLRPSPVSIFFRQVPRRFRRFGLFGIKQAKDA